MIFCYNREGVGDVLLVVVKDAGDKPVTTERKGNIARIFLKETGETVAWNIFEVSSLIGQLEGNGQINLTEDQLAKLNTQLAAADFDEKLVADPSPKFVVGYVKSCVDHPDSDHLHITETEIDNNETVQIVCGAPNIEAGIKVVVAKVGAMMPNGLIIWPGKLRGVESNGMICSARELGIPNAPQKKGILVLPEDAEVGKAYTF